MNLAINVTNTTQLTALRYCALRLLPPVSPLLARGAAPRAKAGPQSLLSGLGRHCRLTRILSLLALAIHPLVCVGEEVDSILFSGFPDKASVSRVYADGRVERIEIPSTGRGGGSLAYGGNEPTPSPDGKHVAYMHDGEPWIFDTRNKATWKISPDAKLSNTFFTSWSWDGRRLLYYLQPPASAEPSRKEIVDRMIYADSRGFRVYDLAKKKTEPVAVELPGRFVAWHADGSMLLILGDGPRGTLSRWRPGEGSPKTLVAERANYGQFFASRDGRSVVALAHFDHKTSEVVRIDTASSRLIRLTPTGGFAEYNWPTLSPSGQKLAYFQRRGLLDGRVVRNLIVNGRTVFRSLGWGSYSWINEKSIVVRDDCALSILDLSDSTLVAEHKVSAGSSPKFDCRGFGHVR